MKQVDVFIDELYQNVRDTAHVRELKEEMRVHLLESIDELQSQGLSLEESIQTAFDKFGDVDKLKKELTENDVIRRTRARRFLALIVILGVLGSAILLLYSIWNDNISQNKVNQVFDEFKIYANSDKEMSEELLAGILKNNASISAIGFKRVPAGKASLEYPYEYVYPASTPIDSYGEFENPSPNGIWFTNNYKYSLQSQGKNDHADIAVDVMLWKFPFKFYLMGRGLLILYWLLFIVWATTNLYVNHTQKKWKWIIIFTLFNVIGYWLYIDEIKSAQLRRSWLYIKMIACIVGLYIGYRGIKLMLLPTRSENMVINELGIDVPLNTQSLVIYGAAFVLAGIFLVFIPFKIHNKLVWNKG
ncbi:permease prefix domain 1-containing protein [Paenibacillus algorifonticola]|uniref:permease prefix domain 1-containing protein n=1 Tax=Paenibacillus algorifonticola TaxID=684063 RepID=UPI003D2B87C5